MQPEYITRAIYFGLFRFCFHDLVELGAWRGSQRGRKESAPWREGEGERSAYVCGGIRENAWSFSLSVSLPFFLFFSLPLYHSSFTFPLSLLFYCGCAHTHTHISALARTRAHPQCIQYSRLSSSLVFDPHLSRSADPGNLLCRDRASIDS